MATTDEKQKDAEDTEAEGAEGKEASAGKRKLPSRKVMLMAAGGLVAL